MSSVHNEKESTMTSNNVTHARVGDDRAVRAVLDGVYAAWADNDADAFVVGYAEDATAILPDTYLPDKEAIRANMAQAFAGPLKSSSAVHEVQSIRFVGARTAVVVSKGAILFAGQAEPSVESESLESWILSGQDGIWRVRAFHNCPAKAG
jgi:uncharacterized protein (TIGR02246 family)